LLTALEWMLTFSCRAHTPLPENWNFVALDKKMRDKLEAAGIAYEQEAIRAPRG